MRASIVVSCVFAVSFFATGLVAADDSAPPSAHKEGHYGGVRPGELPSGDKARRVPAGTLGWVGFAEKDRSAEVFLQAGSAFEVSQRIEGSTLVVHLAGLRKQVRGTRRPIDVRFFDTSLARITTKVVSGKRSKSGVEVRVSFKSSDDAKEASVRTSTESDGLHYAYLSFPPGTRTEAPAARPAVEADVE